MQLHVKGLRRVQLRIVVMCSNEVQLAAAVRNCCGKKLLAYLPRSPGPGFQHANIRVSIAS